MSEELGNQLQRLYRDFYARRLEFGDYRYRRALLLDSLGADAAVPAADDATRPRQLDPVAEETVVMPPPMTDEPERSFRWYYVVAACAVVVLGVVWFVTRQIGVPDARTASEPTPGRAPDVAAVLPDPDPSATRRPVVDVEPRIVAPGQDLVEEFVARQDWRELNLQEFQDSWLRLPESDRIVAKGAVWFQPLSESLAYRIEETLDFSVDPENDEQLAMLYGFALQLGLVELVPGGWTPNRQNGGRTVAALPVNEPAPAAPLPEVPPAPAPERAAPEPAAAERAATEPAAAEAGREVASAAEPEPADETLPADATPDNAEACSADQLRTRRRNCRDSLSIGGQGPLLRILPAGQFTGTDPAGASQTITIPAPFAISVYEIRVAEYNAFCTATGTACPADPWSDDDMPVVGVSWEDASAYAAWLAGQTGQSYRLPTAGEWEYAARGGADTDYPYGDRLLPAQARYSSITAYDSPLPADDRTTQRNGFGLWHAVGNVREWVNADGPAPGQKMVRGGSYASNEEELRHSTLLYMDAGETDRQTGIRLLREL